MPELPNTVRFEAGVLHLLDQRQLPAVETVRVCRDLDDVVDAIRTLTVRGAPAIGIAAAFGLAVGIGDSLSRQALLSRAETLKAARPTAVNLAWAVDRVVAATGVGDPVDVRTILDEAALIQREDEDACRRIGEHGVDLVASAPRVLTHCNAGALAVSRHGTALAPIYEAHRRGVDVHVWVDETRPLLQGSRLTAYELTRSGIPCTLITDSMAGRLMDEGLVDLVIVGADRVAANGDVANKIGTLGVAVLCNHFNIPFYVACPWSTVDPHTPTGRDIEIEERESHEVTRLGDWQVAPEEVGVRNPAFDVTPATLVRGIITESGVFDPAGITGARAAHG